MRIMIAEEAQPKEIAARMSNGIACACRSFLQFARQCEIGPPSFSLTKLLSNRSLRCVLKTLAWQLLIICPVGNTIKAKNMKTAKILAIVAATALGLGAAQATQINGTVGFTSATNHPMGPGGNVVSNGGGSFTLNFNNPLSVNFGTDDYIGTTGTDVTFSAITFQNGVGLIGTNVPEWSFTVGAKSYSFDLLSLSVATFHNGALTLMGEGVAHISGFTNTQANFALEATGSHLTFDILQPSNTAVPAPDGGSALALLGIGLVAVEVLRRKLATA